MPKKKRHVFFLLIFSVLLFGFKSDAEEYNLKAAFIYNFTKYIKWNSSPGNEFSIGIIGLSSINERLIEIAAVQTVDGKKINVIQYAAPGEIKNCNILFISKNTNFQLETILAKVEKGTLTVSEKEGYSKLGTMINFVIRNDKLKFEINRTAITSGGLTASSELLKLAILIE